MGGFWGWPLDESGFAPRRESGTWDPGLGWLRVGSALCTWLAFVSIPVVLLSFARRRRLPLSGLPVLFAVVVIACGFTHLIDALTFYEPVYRLSGLAKLLTAVLSWTAVVA